MKRYGVVPSHFGDDNEARAKNFEKALKAFKNGDAFENWTPFLDICVNQAMMIISVIGGSGEKVLVGTLPATAGVGKGRNGCGWILHRSTCRPTWRISTSSLDKCST